MLFNCSLCSCRVQCKRGSDQNTNTRQCGDWSLMQGKLVVVTLQREKTW